MRLVVIVVAALTLAPAPAPIQITARSRSLQPGEIVLLAIELPAAIERIRVRAFDREVPAYRDGDRLWRALVGIDLDVKPGNYQVTVEECPKGRRFERLIPSDMLRVTGEPRPGTWLQCRSCHRHAMSPPEPDTIFCDMYHICGCV